MNGFHSLSWSALAALPSAGLLDWLARITMVLALVWLAHFLMRNINPRWRILLWRAALLGLIGVAILALREPLLEFSLLPPVPRSTAIKESPTREAVDRINTTERTSREPAGPRPVPPGIIPNGIVQETAPLEARSVPAAPVDAEQDRTTAPRDHWSPLEWTLLIWTLGAAWGVLRLIAGLVNIVHIRRTSMAVPAWIEGEAIQAIGPNIRVEIRHSTHVATPCSVGLFRNTILLPADLGDEDRREEVRAALAHESAHFQGHDLRWNHLLHVFSIVLWFHPLAWRIRLAHADACDERCDAEAARLLGDSLGYGRSLARLALTVSGRVTPVALSMARQSTVSRRITLLKKGETMHLSPWRVLIVASLFGGLMLAIGTVGLAPTNAADDDTQSSPSKAHKIEEPATSDTKVKDEDIANFPFKKKVRVVDPEGDPIAGATVASWAIRSIGHGSWSKNGQGGSEPPVLTTNADGIAVIPVPRYAISAEKIPPRALTVRVAHPDFAETMYNDVPVTPDKRDKVTTITMHPGAIVDILLEGHKVEQMSADDLYALTSSPSKNWFRKVLLDDRGVLHLPRIPAGEDLIRLVYLPDDGPPVFSNVVPLSFIEGERVALMFDMERSVSVEGELSDDVPRPVKNGRVVAEVIVDKEDIGDVSWRVWAKVKEDGSFTLDGLPRGDLQVIAICDDFMAESGEPPEFVSEDERRQSDSRPRPQVFKLADDVTPITVEMTQTGGARFRVLHRGEPVEGAKVSLWPNVKWWGGGSQFYAEPLIGSIKMIKDPEQARIAAENFELFSATTNEDGTAFIKSLPPGGQSYNIQHDTLEMPISEEYSMFRYDDINVTAGEITDVTVSMQPKGTQPLKKRPENPVVPADEESPSRPTTSVIPKLQPPKIIPTQAAETELAGVVVDEDGNPLEGVDVDAWMWQPGNETKTDAQGRFVLKGLNPDEPVAIEFTKPGYSPSLFIAQEPGTDDWTIVLTQGTWLEGVVTDPSGKPVPDTLVRAKRGPFRNPGGVITEVWTETKTDKNGKYRLHLEPDTYEVQVRVPKVGVARHDGVELAAKQKKIFDLKLDPGVTFRAVVRNSVTGKPVEGIILWNWRQPGIEGTSDENGVLEIPGLFEGEFEFNVTAEGVNRRKSSVAGEFARWWSPQAVEELERLYKKPDRFQRNFDGLTFDIKKNGEEIEIFVEPAVTITGRVIDPNGDPVEGATVSLAKTGSGNSITGDTRFSYQTDEQGRFEMQAPASGEAEYNLIAHDGKYHEWRNWANSVAEPFKTTPGETITDIELQLQKPGTVRGRVTDAAGEPVKGEEVRAFPTDGRSNRYYVPTTETDAEGNYELKFVRPGKQWIQIEPFWMDPSEAPEKTTQTADITAGEAVEGIDFTMDAD